jgi:hypothetical protein
MFKDHGDHRVHMDGIYRIVALRGGIGRRRTDVLASNLVWPWTYVLFSEFVTNETKVPIRFVVFTQVHHRASACVPVHSNSLGRLELFPHREMTLNLGL